jgi:predicted SAM-dependent methyltransferase
VKISLGAGQEPELKEGWVNVDLVKLPNIQLVHNLMEVPYPFDNESAEYIKAKDLIEHLSGYSKDGRPIIIAFLEECYRILIPGGTLWIQTPSWDADFLWVDPTHVRGFDKHSFDFFDPDTDFGKATGFYSKAKFKVSVEELENKNLIFRLIKI